METMQDKFMTTVRIGPKGQIVIPKEVRAMFGLEPGGFAHPAGGPRARHRAAEQQLL